MNIFLKFMDYIDFLIKRISFTFTDFIKYALTLIHKTTFPPISYYCKYFVP